MQALTERYFSVIQQFCKKLCSYRWGSGGWNPQEFQIGMFCVLLFGMSCLIAARTGSKNLSQKKDPQKFAMGIIIYAV